MFRLAEEFTFIIAGGEQPTNFTGQLIFKSRVYNNLGTLYTPPELQRFVEILNTLKDIPEYWTLEIIAEYLFKASKPVLPSLYAINLFLTEQPQRVAEYSIEGYESSDDILELPVIG